MVICCWSAKGGAGCSTIATALAIQFAKAHDTLLIDFGGDAPSLLGVGDPDEGVTDWLAAGSDVPIDALRRLETPVTDRLSMLARGGANDGDIDSGRGDVLAHLLQASARPTIVDVGTVALGEMELSHVARSVCASADDAVLVTRACFLAMQRAQRASVRASAMVVIAEPGRALGRRDLEDALGVAVVASVPFDPAIARTIDAGMLAQRQPRSLRRGLAGAFR